MLIFRPKICLILYPPLENSTTRITITQDSSVKEVLIKFPNVIMFNWNTLAHRVLFDISSIMRRLWLNSLLLRMMLTKSRSKNKTTYATTRLVLQKGLEIKAQLQKHALRVKLSSVDMRKGQKISEANYFVLIFFKNKNICLIMP